MGLIIAGNKASKMLQIGLWSMVYSR